jgi:molybdate transport system regulatory protein
MTSLPLTGHLELGTADGPLLGDQRVRLLEAIAEHGSISQAARHVPLSYKAAWEAVEAMNNLADRPLVDRSAGGRDGGGTRLTEHGRRIVALYRAMEAENRRALARLAGHFDSLAPDDAAAMVEQIGRQIRRLSLRSSARNQFAGKVSGLRDGPVDFEVRVQVADALEIVAVVTRASAQQLGLAIGSELVALVKASSVLLHAEPGLRLSARNQLWGSLARIVDGPVNAEVTLDLGQGRSAVAVLPREALAAMALREGDRACAAFKVSSVILHVID